jgi:hypothetical protein
MPEATQLQFGSAAASSSADKAEEQESAGFRVSKKFTLSVPIQIDPAMDNGSEKVVKNMGAAIRELVSAAAGGVEADAEHLLVESIEGKAYLANCGKCIAVSIEGVKGIHPAAAGQVRADGSLASSCNFVAHAGEITTGSLYAADKSHKDTLRFKAAGATEIHTDESLKVHEDQNKHGLFVHCASPVWTALTNLPDSLHAELSSKRNKYNDGSDEEVTIQIHDKATYAAARAHLIAQSRANAVHHIDLTGMQVKFADAEGAELNNLPAALEGAAQAVKTAHSSTMHYGKLDLAVKFYVDVPAEQ